MRNYLERFEHAAACLDEDEELLRRGAYPLTAYQKNYYHYWESFGDVIMGNVAMILRFRKDMYDPEQIADAAYTVLRQHPAYSTVIYRDENGELMQRFDPVLTERPAITRMSTADFEERKRELVRLFDLRKRLYRCEIFDTEDRICLFLDTHHIVTDAVSTRIFMRDLMKAIQGEELAEDHYCSYLSHLALISEGVKAEAAADDAYSRHPVFDKDGMLCTGRDLYLENDLTSAEMRELAKSHGYSVTKMLMAVILRAMGEFNHTDKVMANWLYSGRNALNKSDMCGLMICAIPVAVDLGDYRSMDDLCLDIRRINKKNMALSELSPGSNTGRPILDDTITVNFIPYSGDVIDGGFADGVQLESFVGHNQGNSNILYLIYVEQRDDVKPVLYLRYNNSMYSDESMERFAGLVKKYLEA